jgi:hypothetical protein
MSHTSRRGRPQRHYRIRVRTERRDPIDYAKLAQAALEQAAMDQRGDAESSDTATAVPQANHSVQPEEPCDDRLA